MRTRIASQYSRQEDLAIQGDEKGASSIPDPFSASEPRPGAEGEKADIGGHCRTRGSGQSSVAGCQSLEVGHKQTLPDMDEPGMPHAAGAAWPPRGRHGKGLSKSGRHAGGARRWLRERGGASAGKYSWLFGVCSRSFWMDLWRRGGEGSRQGRKGAKNGGGWRLGCIALRLGGLGVRLAGASFAPAGVAEPIHVHVSRPRVEKSCVRCVLFELPFELAAAPARQVKKPEKRPSGG